MKIISLLFLLTSFTAFGTTLKFIGACNDNFILKTEQDDFVTVGELTVGTLTRYRIPYIGNEQGLSSVFETPIGDSAIEVVSKDEFRTYGWCYFVNGVLPEVLPHESKINSTDEVTWVFSYARSFKGVWTDQCLPAWKVKPKFLCDEE